MYALYNAPKNSHSGTNKDVSMVCTLLFANNLTVECVVSVDAKKKLLCESTAISDYTK